MTNPDNSPGRWWFGIDRKWWTLAIVGAGTFMSALDGSVVNTVLPIIRDATHAPFSTVTWVVLIYLLTVSSFLLVFGRLADIYGQKGIYLTGLVVFALGSLLCGLSGHVALLIAFRAVQGIGAAMLFAIGPAVITAAFPAGERGRALGLQATMTYLGLSTGPALGGFLAQQFGWPSIFFVNVPIGAIVALVGLRAIERQRRPSGQPLDPAGAASLAAGLALVLLGLSLGNEIGWGNRLTWGSLAVGGIVMAAFVVIEMRVEHPVLDLRLFSNRVFAASTTAAFLSYLATAAANLLLPFYLENANGYGPGKAGLILVATPIVMVLTTWPSGALSDKIGSRIPSTVGMVLTVLGLLSLRSIRPGDPASDIVPRLVLLGLGSGLFTSPNNSAIMGSAPRERQGVAGAILAAARNIGFAMGVALGGVVYSARMGSFSGHMSRSWAITRSVQDAVTVVACVAAVGVVVSAVRGRTPPASRSGH